MDLTALRMIVQNNLDMSRKNILHSISESRSDERLLKAEGFDDAVIGVDTNSSRLIYSISKCIEILIADGMSEEEAQEHFSYNVSGSYVGENTPIWCEDKF